MTARKFIAALLLGLIILSSSNHPPLTSKIVAIDPIDDLQNQIDDLKKAMEMSVNATKPLEATLEKLNADLNNIIARVKIIEQDLAVKRQKIENGEEKLGEQEDILAKRVRSFYIRRTQINPISIIFSKKKPGEFLRELAYQEAATNEDKKVITEIVLYIKDLEEKKKQLESEDSRLAKIKQETDKQAAFFQKEIIGAKAYQQSLSSQIAELSAKQQQILAEKLASLHIPLSAYNTQGGCSSDLTNGKDPGFSPGFGFFTYGVPNRVGLNQYGAKGRADSGQNYDQILHAYYNFDDYQNFDTNMQITVEGYGTYSLEEYLKRIYEVPNDWPMESLRAQAIAARSYVLAYTNKGSGSICATESCQVFKPDPKGGSWEQAVNDTAGKAMIQGGNPIKAWFSSTHGGYVFSSGDIGWNQTSWTKRVVDSPNTINSFDDLKSNAYDKASPWFYCDWGSRSQYGGTAWLKPDELADIINVLLLLQNDSSVKEHLYQTDKGNPAGTDTWDAGRVKQELSKYRTPFNSITDVSLDWDKGSGITTNVNISGDAPSASFNGSDFKSYFNLRAPANIQIVGPLFSVEKH